mmetsp:Transcript_135321/g.337640  ORF Transcript_135321/g.337640 Transcript_135321/m.337640 type:complete len:530 (+) Transcript_135321:102-1691(+)
MLGIVESRSWLAAVLLIRFASPLYAEKLISASSVASDLCLRSCVVSQSCGGGVDHDGSGEASDLLEEDGVQAFEDFEVSAMRVEFLQTTLSIKRGRSAEFADHGMPMVEVASGQSVEQAVKSTPEFTSDPSMPSGANGHAPQKAEPVARRIGEVKSLGVPARSDQKRPLGSSAKWTTSEIHAKLYGMRHFILAGLCIAMMGFAWLAVYVKSLQPKPICLKPQAVDSLVATSAIGPSSLQQAIYGKRAGLERGGFWDFRSEGARPPSAAPSSTGWSSADAAAGRELPGGGRHGESGLVGEPSAQPPNDQAPASALMWVIPPLCLDCAPSQQHEPLLIMPYDCVGEGASSFDIVAASGEPVLHIALRGASGSRSLEVSRVPARGQALASVRVELSSGHSHSFILSSGCCMGALGSIWGSLRPPPTAGHGSSVLVRHSDGEVVAGLPAASAEGHFRLVTPSGETCASSLIASAGDVVAGTRQLQICIRQGVDPVLVLCCFIAPLVLSPPCRFEPQHAPSDDPADLGWSRTSD